ncbi:MAG TPA: DUF1232 domain-containing protein [Thermoanaerobacterales bacterium]|nr:DUF1232 domain-containing protein [Thermoanaerobacterales bacterium]
MSGGKSLSLLREAWVAIKYLLDPAVPINQKIWIIASLLYLISPVDFMPDPIFGIGVIDDIVVILLMLSFMAARLKKYDENKNTSDSRPGDARDTIDVEYEVLDDDDGDK